MQNRLILILILTSVSLSLFSQLKSDPDNKVRVLVGLNRNISLNFQTIEFDNYTESSNFTSTLGGHVGVQLPIMSNTHLQFLTGILINAYYNKEFSSFGSTTSSGSFNVKYLGLRLNHDLNLKKENVRLRLGLGADYNFPGEFRAARNGFVVDGLFYKSNFGYQGKVGLLVAISKFELLFYAGFRSMDFELDSYTSGSVADLDESMIDLKAHALVLGIEFFF